MLDSKPVQDVKNQDPMLDSKPRQDNKVLDCLYLGDMEFDHALYRPKLL